MTRTGTLPKDLAQRVLTVAEAAEVLGIARSSAYSAVRSGELPSIVVGRRILVPGVALLRKLEGAAPSRD